MDRERPAPLESNLMRNLRIRRSSKDAASEMCRRTGIGRQRISKSIPREREPLRATICLNSQYRGGDMSVVYLSTVRLSAILEKKSDFSIGVRARD